MPLFGPFRRRASLPALDATTDDQHRRNTRVAVIAALALLLLGGPAALFSSFVLAFASDACAGGATGAPICQPSVQVLVFVLPLVALLAGMLLCVLGIVVARRGRPPVGWTVSGWAVFVLALVVAYTLATAG